MGSFLIAVVLITGIGILSYFILFRPVKNHPPLNLLIIAIGLYFFLEACAIFLTGGQTLWGSIPVPWEGAIHLGSTIISKQELLLLVVTPLLIFATYWFVYRTKMGSSVRAVAQDPFAASLVGIKENHVMMITFALASALAGTAGALWGASRAGDHPHDGLDADSQGIYYRYFWRTREYDRCDHRPGYIIGLTESIGAGLFQGYLPFSARATRMRMHLSCF